MRVVFHAWHRMRRALDQFQFKGLKSVLLGLLLVSGATIADKSSLEAGLETIYEYSGVHAHLSWVHTTVLEETRVEWKVCGPEQNRQELEQSLSESLSIDALRKDFILELKQRITAEQVAQIVAWTNSDAGKNIQQAEIESIDFDETEFATMLEAYKQSDVHGDERTIRLKNTLADTGAVYFLSALNTELSALVAIASVCSNNENDIAAAQKQIREDRGAEAIYRSFMRQELVVPSAIVYRNITNEELDALMAFSKTEAGDAYFTAMIKGTRSLLAGKVDVLTKVLEAMPSSD